MRRREFLENLLAAGSLALVPQAGHAVNLGVSATDRLGPRLPLRPFGRSGEKVTVLGVGGFHIGSAPSERLAQEVIETGLEEGVRFFDTAANYQKGRSEERYGKFLTPKYREDVFLLTKTAARTPEKATAEVEQSLSRMKSDYVDAVLVHAIGTVQDAEARVNAGVFDALVKLKEAGKIRYLGFSGHLETASLLRFLELLDGQLDVALMPINVVDPSDSDSFIEKVLPKLAEGGIAPLAMKTAAYGNFIRKNVKIPGGKEGSMIPTAISMQEAFEFVLSLPVSSWISGMENRKQVIHNAKIAREFTGLDEAKRNELVEKVYGYRNNPDLEHYRRWK